MAFRFNPSHQFGSVAQFGWQCETCRVLNRLSDVQCIACETPAPSPSVAVANDNKDLRVLRDITKLYIDQELTDIVFEVEGENIPAHKVIVAARSQYFRTLLYGGMRESSSDEAIQIQNVSTENFRRVLRYLYTGDPGPLNTQESMTLIHCADMYQLDELKRMCETCIQASITTDNVLGVLNHAHHYNSDWLKSSALEFILRNIQNPALKEALKACDANITQEVLSYLVENGQFQGKPESGLSFFGPSTSSSTGTLFGRPSTSSSTGLFGTPSTSSGTGFSFEGTNTSSSTGGFSFGSMNASSSTGGFSFGQV